MQHSSAESRPGFGSKAPEWLQTQAVEVDETLLDAMTVYFLHHSNEWRDADDVRLCLSRQYGETLSPATIQAALELLILEETLVQSAHKDELYRLA